MHPVVHRQDRHPPARHPLPVDWHGGTPPGSGGGLTYVLGPVSAKLFPQVRGFSRERLSAHRRRESAVGDSGCVAKGPVGTLNDAVGQFAAGGRGQGRCPDGHPRDVQRPEGHLQDIATVLGGTFRTSPPSRGAPPRHRPTPNSPTASLSVPERPFQDTADVRSGPFTAPIRARPASRKVADLRKRLRRNPAQNIRPTPTRSRGRPALPVY
jgi:hypothetical protein